MENAMAEDADALIDRLPVDILAHIFLFLSSFTDLAQEIFPSHVKLFVQNDALAALASGTMGELHGCVLIAGTSTIAYVFTEDGKEARAAGAGPILGDWGRTKSHYEKPREGDHERWLWDKPPYISTMMALASVQEAYLLSLLLGALLCWILFNL